MKVTYSYWEPDKGLEEHQAKIYTENNPNNPVTAEQIQSRLKGENIDPKTVMYAFDEDGKPLAYIQARDYSNRETHLGFPWAVKDCPEEVQEKLFNEMFEYVKERAKEKNLELKMPTSINNEKKKKFAESKGFVEGGKYYRFNIDLISASKIDLSGSTYITRKGTKADIEMLIDFALTDEDVKNAFPNREAWLDYFNNRVFKEDDGHVVLVYKGDTLVDSSAPLLFNVNNEEEQSIILRFRAKKTGEDSFKTLLAAVAKECIASGWPEKPIALFGDDSSEVMKITDVVDVEKVLTGITYVYPKK
ncbi:MAG: hypothetical protein ACTSP4_15880 [Candidatus Hodarchaeales archaeon]